MLLGKCLGRFLESLGLVPKGGERRGGGRAEHNEKKKSQRMLGAVKMWCVFFRDDLLTLHMCGHSTSKTPGERAIVRVSFGPRGKRVLLRRMPSDSPSSGISVSRERCRRCENRQSSGGSGRVPAGLPRGFFQVQKAALQGTIGMLQVQ